MRPIIVRNSLYGRRPFFGGRAQQKLPYAKYFWEAEIPHKLSAIYKPHKFEAPAGQWPVEFYEGAHIQNNETGRVAKIVKMTPTGLLTYQYTDDGSSGSDAASRLQHEFKPVKKQEFAQMSNRPGRWHYNLRTGITVYHKPTGQTGKVVAFNPPKISVDFGNGRILNSNDMQKLDDFLPVKET